MLLQTLAGVLLGTITGLIPGIHPNLVATVLSNVAFDGMITIIFITAIAHTFLNTIPTIHLSSPDPESALALHPSQEYSQKGKAHEAVLLTLVGSVISLIFISIMIPLMLKIIKPTYYTIEKIIPLFLLLTAIFLVLHQKNKLIALGIFVLSGIIGYVALNSQINEPLLAIFTGLFGIPALLINSEKNVTQQKITEPEITKDSLNTITKSLFFGSFFSFLPSVGPAQAATIQTTITKNNSKGDYLILTGCLNTVNILFSLVMLIELNKSRNGAVAVIRELGFSNLSEIFNLFALSLMILFPCTLACILLSRAFVKLRNKISTKKLSRATIILISSITLALSGILGFIFMIVSSVIGYLPYRLKTSKTVLMGSLMIPTLIFYAKLMLN
ncbi:hypothetical protein HOF78_00245 [Candidatus Woesearchaeota archaeon]|jgi:putative membrane protein|nr:hypothetical protein [Candidatus Woesearchaeota archaeon]MBT6044604.1 hypothetical protein [Candidatus Woesearchaeota archaeon]